MKIGHLFYSKEVHLEIKNYVLF